MSYPTNDDYHYDEENIFFIIKYLLRSKSLVDAVLNVSESKLKQSVVDRSTINLTTMVKLKDVLKVNDTHYDPDIVYDAQMVYEYLEVVTSVLSKSFMKYLSNNEPQVLEYITETGGRPRVKINMTDFEIEFGSPLIERWGNDENEYFFIRYSDILETFK